MADQERIRLLLIDSGKENRAANITTGVGNVLGRWPSYIASAIWCTVCTVSIAALVTVLTIVLLINERFMTMGHINTVILPKKLNNEFCKRATDRENYIAGRSVISLADPQTIIHDTSANLFYSLIRPLNRKEACGIESVLRLCPDKSIYLMYFDRPVEARRYESVLRRTYSNLNEINADGPNYVRASPFEGLWRKDNASVLATDLLTVWQFGGTALSPNLIMASRKMLDSDDPDCLVDREFVFCPEQCSSYVYRLISTLNRNMNGRGRHDDTEDVIDQSVAEFCGSSDYARTGCAGVTRVDDSLMCTTSTPRCMFIRIDQWATNDRNWFTHAAQFCPHIMKLKK